MENLFRDEMEVLHKQKTLFVSSDPLFQRKNFPFTETVGSSH